MKKTALIDHRCKVDKAWITRFQHLAKVLLFIPLLLALSASTPLTGQTPYRLTAGGDAVFSGITLGTLTLGNIQTKKIKPLTMAEINALEIEDVPGIDRFSIRQYAHGAHKASNAFFYPSFALPLTLLAGTQSRNNFGEAGVIWLETLALNAALTNVTKMLFRRTRPLAYNEGYPFEEKLTRNARTSFISGHASFTAAMSIMTAKMYTDFYPDGKNKGLVWASACAIPAITGYLRMKAGKHFFTDVLAGFVVGAAVGYLVPELHRIR